MKKPFSKLDSITRPIAQSLILVSVFVTAVFTCSGAAGNELESRITEYMEAAVEVWGFQGAVLVAAEGEVIANGGWGPADAEGDREVRADTKFLIGSITKPITAIAIMQLWERGTLKLSDSVADHISVIPDDVGKKITIRHLLTHSSGLPDYVAIPGFQERATDPIMPEEIVDYFKDMPLRFEPGTVSEYSSSGFVLLGMILEKVTGVDYETYLKKHVFEPAGMNDTGIFPDYAGRSDFAVGYEQDSLGDLVRSRTIHPSAGFSAGALSSTVGDLYALDRALHGTGLLSRKSVEEMLTEHRPHQGYGWYIDRLGGHLVVAHGGGTPGFTTMFQRWIEDDICVVVLSNNVNVPDFTIATSLAAISLDAPYSVPVKRTPLNPNQSVLRSYCGIYKSGTGAEWNVDLEGDRLTLTDPEGRKAMLLCESESLFYSEYSPSSTVTFFKDDNGDVIGIDVRRPFLDERADRIRGRGNGDVSDRRSAVETPVRPAVEIPADVLAGYSGRYQMSPVDFILTITVRDGVLYAEALGSPPVEMIPVSRRKFALKNLTARVEFLPGADGAVDNLTFTQEGLEGTGKRLTDGGDR